MLNRFQRKFLLLYHHSNYIDFEWRFPVERDAIFIALYNSFGGCAFGSRKINKLWPFRTAKFARLFSTSKRCVPWQYGEPFESSEFEL